MSVVKLRTRGNTDLCQCVQQIGDGTTAPHRFIAINDKFAVSERDITDEGARCGARVPDVELRALHRNVSTVAVDMESCLCFICLDLDAKRSQCVAHIARVIAEERAG